MQKVRLFALGCAVAFAASTQGCGTSDSAALGPDAVLGDVATGGDVGGLDGQTGDTSKADTSKPDGGGGLCGDGVCDPLESSTTCPLDCKVTTQTPFQCLQANCGAQIGACTTEATCAIVLGCIAGCSDAACLGECRTKAFANGATPTVQELFGCAGEVGCGKPQTSVCGNLVCEAGESATCPQDCGGGKPICGNGVCEQGEQDGACPEDCGSVKPVCGDGVCSGGENPFSCPNDCTPNPTCGDGVCSEGEQFSCPEDCVSGPVCGNAVCEFPENAKSCPKDCGPPGPVCGDGACTPGESAGSCPADCAKPICGDNICAASESPASCPQDCGGDPLSCAKTKCPDQVKTCLSDPPCAKLFACFANCTDDVCYETCFKQAGEAAMVSFMPLAQCGEKFCNGANCGDGVCEGDESSKTCPKDCPAGPICGNGACEPGESSQSCPQDCGPPPAFCGNGKCEKGESSFNCPKDCGPIQPVCGNGSCEPGESSQSCPKDCGAPSTCGNGKCEAGESMLSCPQDCFQATDLLVCAKQNCEKTYVACINVAACAKALDCIAKCKDTGCLQSCAAQNPASLQQLAPLGQCVQNAGCLGGSTGPICGNGQCESGESSFSCPQDCGQIKPVCGNGKCENGESSESCPKDCGPPKPVCGNNKCEPGEDANTCPFDCGPGSCKNQCGGQGSNGQCWCDQQCMEFGDCCGDFKEACPSMLPVCGNGQCEPGESTQTCPKDCQQPGPVCGDGICQDPEPKTCPSDCGPPKPVCGNGICEPDESKTCPKDCSTSKPCKSKADCASTEVCCNGAAGQVCVPAGQCF